MAKKSNKKSKKQKSHGVCVSCGTGLGITGGMGGTDLCGPCCTGESETLYEYGISW